MRRMHTLQAYLTQPLSPPSKSITGNPSGRARSRASALARVSTHSSGSQPRTTNRLCTKWAHEIRTEGVPSEPQRIDQTVDPRGEPPNTEIKFKLCPIMLLLHSTTDG